MGCNHIKELYKYVKDYDLNISAIDIISVECKKCSKKEVCETIPSI